MIIHYISCIFSISVKMKGGLMQNQVSFITNLDCILFFEKNEKKNQLFIYFSVQILNNFQNLMKPKQEFTKV